MSAAVANPPTAADATEADDDLEFGEEWADQIARRIEDRQAGRTKGVPWDEDTAAIKAKYGWD